MTAPKKPIHISDIFAENERVELPSGRIAEVRPVDAIGYELYLDLVSGSGADVRNIWKIAARSLPDVPAEEVENLTAPQAMAIIAIATGRVALVQQLAAEIEEKTEAPDPAEPTSRPPSNATQPDSSVSESPAN